MNPERFDLVKLISCRLLKALVIWLAVCITILVVSLIVADRVPVIMATLCFGILGGLISLHRRLKTMSIYDLRLLGQSWNYTILSPLVGGLLGCILYIIFISELVSGDFFPKFELDDADRAKYGTLLFQDLLEVHAPEVSDYAKLLVWAFIAGFSEKFVVNILGQFEASGSNGDGLPVSPGVKLQAEQDVAPQSATRFPSRIRRVATNLNLNQRRAPGSGCVD